jgi:hypothetical protein
MRYLLSLLSIMLAGLAFGQQPTTSSKVGTGWTFRPTYLFKGSSLTGFRALVGADWKAQNGELIATLKPGVNTSWLMLDQRYQDVGFHALFRCTGGSETGVLFRLEQTAEGFKGVLFYKNEK